MQMLHCDLLMTLNNERDTSHIYATHYYEVAHVYSYTYDFQFHY